MNRVVVTFPQGKFKVLTLSYDDGRAADRRLLQILNENGIKGSFHLNAGLQGSSDRIPAAELKELYTGHEVSAHTLTHPTMARISNEQLIHEIIEDRKGLECIVDYPVRGMSYPNGSYNSRIKEMLPALGIEYARTVRSTGTFALPDDLHEWHPTCHHNRDLMKLAEDFIALHKSQYLYMMYVWGHSYEFDNDNNWDLMEQFCQLIGGRDDIWYATNIEYVNYMKAFERLQFAASQEFVYNPSSLSVWLKVDDERTIEIKGGCQASL
jgi:peptidoglycan/xylan/chitin deacetylase (PgdA/CDA1 family)